jgi:phosphomannomutase
MRFTVQEIMAQSGVKFGTSGARGAVDSMTDRVCYVYTLGFLQYLRAAGLLKDSASKVAVAGDLRPSTPRIMAAVFRAITDFGGVPVNCEAIPSPAVALAGFEQGIPSIMVTGSHIPDDRNGIKFNKPGGELLKEDEAPMTAQAVEVPDELFTADGKFRTQPRLPRPDPGARRGYLQRFLRGFPGKPLNGVRLGLYQHSAVGRDVVMEILRGLGAEVLALGRSDRFIPVDTEAIRPEDSALARQWAAQDRFDALVSTDGDSDRPLISDERGEWLRGDIAGILCARFLGADSISTPVTSNSAVEKCGWFPEVRRTRIGSPYVVASMMAASAQRQRVVGYEANGGFLLYSNISRSGLSLRALPTRDAVVVLISVLLLALREKKTVAQLVQSLPARFTASNRLQAIPASRSREILARYDRGDEAADRAAFEADFGAIAAARVTGLDRTDGLRATFENEEVLHLRPSGNAPEFRCYSEAASPARAEELCSRVLAVVERL